MTAENTNYRNDILLRISPRTGKILVEEHKDDGAVSYKEISPVDLYYVLNSSYADTSLTHTGFLPGIVFRPRSAKRKKSLSFGTRSCMRT